jgi:UDP-glucuronate 4-epimerase
MMRESQDIRSPVHLDHQKGKVLQYFGASRPVHKVVHFMPCHHKAHIAAAVPEWSVTPREAVRQLVKWYEALHQTIMPSGANDIIFTTYFTSSKDPQRKVKMKENNFDYIKVWYHSLHEHNLSAVVFHDGLSEPFTTRLSSANVQFHFSALNNRSTNDARFYIYYHYLLDHPDIQRVILTDISDVQFLKNPFTFMDLLGNMLYIGTDIDMFPTMESMGWMKKRMPQCFGEDSVEKGEVAAVKKFSAVYNAGVIGGTRSLMLDFLSRVVASLDATPPELNCNMPVVNFVAHKYFDHRVHAGYPWTSDFYKRQTDPRGVFMIHK